MKLKEFVPTGKWVLVSIIKEKVTKGGLILPNRMEVYYPSEAKVIKCGPQCEFVKVGDTVLLETIVNAKEMQFSDTKEEFSGILEYVVMGYARNK